jgi:8-oxo-dGTP pyrophosphatase MutT (NUDIX family)
MSGLYNGGMKYSQSPRETVSGDRMQTPITKARLTQWLAGSAAVAESGDNRFADDGETLLMVPGDRPLKAASVLVLVVNHPVPTVVFTQRTPHLTDHAGQISFPGGGVEPGDINAAATALREAEEEIGIDPRAVEIIGELPHYTTGTGFRITPVVGWSADPLQYAPDPSEVAEVFEVPAPFLLDPANHRRESAMYKGRMRSYFAIPFGPRYIWGATAGMLITFSRVAEHAEGWGVTPPITMAPDSA